MMERLDELFDRNDNGEFVKQSQVERLESLSKLCPARLRNHRVISLELANLVAGTKYRGEFEERLQAIVEEVTDERAPPTILFIDGELSCVISYLFHYDVSECLLKQNFFACNH